MKKMNHYTAINFHALFSRKLYDSLLYIFFIVVLTPSNLSAKNNEAPGGIGNASIWFKCGPTVIATSGKVDSWLNSGSITSTAIGTSTSKPDYAAIDYMINFNPTISFRDTNKKLITNTLTNVIANSNGNVVGTQFVVYRNVNSSGGLVYRYPNIFNHYKIAFTNIGHISQNSQSMVAYTDLGEVALLDYCAENSATFSERSLKKNGSTGQIKDNGGVFDSQNTDGEFVIGDNTSFKTEFDIAEIIIYPTILSDADRLKVESYLAIKYGISLGDNNDAKDYISSTNTSLWIANNTFKYNIFGIGKDDGSGLNQTSSNSINSGSGNGTSQSGKGNIVISNPSSLDNNDFLLIGNDNGTLLAQTNDLPASEPHAARLNREWKVSHIGNVGTIDLSIDLTGTAVANKLGSNAALFSLLVDGDGDGDFKTGVVNEIHANSITGSKITFTNLSLPNNAIFTLSMDLNVVWTGATSSDWNTTTNWNTNSVPTITTDITISSAATHQLTINSNVSCHSITLEPKAKLTIDANSTFTVTGNLTLVNDITGAATIINNGTLNVQGSSVVQQYLDFVRNYYISSPVSNAITPINATYFNYLEPGTNTDLNNPGTTPYWNSVAQGSPLTVGTGYIVQTSLPVDIQFNGTLNNGNLSIPLTRTIGKEKEGFNLVGNPYPSYINWQMIAAANSSILPTCWFRTKNTAGEYIFVTINTESGLAIVANVTANTTITKFIPPVQAFWVRVANGVTNTNLSLNNSMRSHADVAGNTLKTHSGSINPLMRLEVANTLYSDEGVMYFNPNALDGYDRYDSPKMFNNNPDIPEVYFQVGTEQLVIDGMKNIPLNSEIPLGLNTYKNGTYTLKVKEFVGFDPTIKVVIIDKLNSNTETEISNGTPFTLTENAISGNSNYSIMFKNSGTGIKDVQSTSNNIKVFVGASHQINIISNQDCKFTVFNLKGQKVSTGRTNYNTIVTDVNTKGVYIVKCYNSSFNKNFKVIIN